MSQPKYTDYDLKRVAGIKDEIFNDRLRLVLEVVTDIKVKLDDKPSRNKFNELRADIRTIKVALTDTNHKLYKLDNRVAHLETV